MLRKFAAALLATTLIAGPAFAAQSSGTAGSAPATQAAPAAPPPTPSRPTRSSAPRRNPPRLQAGQARGKACPQAPRAPQDRHDASGAPHQARQNASGQSAGQIRQAESPSRRTAARVTSAGLPATRNSTQHGANRGPGRMHRLAGVRRSDPRLTRKPDLTDRMSGFPMTCSSKSSPRVQLSAVRTKMTKPRGSGRPADRPASDRFCSCKRLSPKASAATRPEHARSRSRS